MELVERLRLILKEQYGIATDEELLKAMETQERMDIGIFVSTCGRDWKRERTRRNYGGRGGTGYPTGRSEAVR